MYNITPTNKIIITSLFLVVQPFVPFIIQIVCFEQKASNFAQ